MHSLYLSLISSLVGKPNLANEKICFKSIELWFEGLGWGNSEIAKTSYADSP